MVPVPSPLGPVSPSRALLELEYEMQNETENWADYLREERMERQAAEAANRRAEQRAIQEAQAHIRTWEDWLEYRDATMRAFTYEYLAKDRCASPQCPEYPQGPQYLRFPAPRVPLHAPVPPAPPVRLSPQALGTCSSVHGNARPAVRGQKPTTRYLTP